MAKENKAIENRIRYKSFSLSLEGPITSEKAIGQGSKLTTLFKSSTYDENKTFRFIGTSEAKDRDNEIVALDGWEFGNYIKNPVVLWGHNQRELPIGKTVGLLKDETKRAIYFDIEFSETYDFAKTVKGLVEEGILNAVSVGFMVKDWDYDDKTGAFIFTKTELFEISIVNVPANQEALIQDEAKEPAKKELKSLSEEEIISLVSRIVSEQVAPKEEPKEDEPADPVIEVTELDGEQPTEVVQPTIDEATINEIAKRVLEAVRLELNTKPEQGDQDGEASSTDPETVDGGEKVTEPEQPSQEPSEPETVLVDISELSEDIGFIIITEEEK
jgi:uncharacterized protein